MHEKLMISAAKCRQLVQLTANLNKIPRSELEPKMGRDSQWYYKIPFEIEITCHSAHITFALVHERIRDGNIEKVKYESVQAEYM